MKIYKTQEEIEADIVDGVLKVNEDVRFEVSFSINADIEVYGNIKARNITAENISALDIDARNITAEDIDARNINARNITAEDITAEDIDARNINARNITAENISALDIEAWNITAGDISFYAVAFARASFKCKSIAGRRDNSKYFCLDGEVEITK